MLPILVHRKPSASHGTFTRLAWSEPRPPAIQWLWLKAVRLAKAVRLVVADDGDGQGGQFGASAASPPRNAAG